MLKKDEKLVLVEAVHRKIINHYTLCKQKIDLKCPEALDIEIYFKLTIQQNLKYHETLNNYKKDYFCD